MGAHCERCDSDLSGEREAIETVDAGVVCRACADEIDAEPLPDVTEPGQYEINETIGTGPDAGVSGTLLRNVATRLQPQGWIVFGVGTLAMGGVSVWQAYPESGGWMRLWTQSGWSLVGGLSVGIMLWAAVCIVMYLD